MNSGSATYEDPCPSAMVLGQAEARVMQILHIRYLNLNSWTYPKDFLQGLLKIQIPQYSIALNPEHVEFPEEAPNPKP